MAASDPGLSRLFAATELMAGMTVTITAVYGFMQLTKVMWIHAPAGHALSTAQLSLIAGQHHGMTLLAMLLGGLIALVVTVAVLEPRPREQALTTLLMPIPMLATMALAIELVAHRSAGIAVLAVVMGVGAYLRKFAPRFGPRVVLYGILLFIGYIFGFLSHGAIADHDLVWIAVIAWLAVLINLLLKVVVYRPLDRGRLRRTGRSFEARARAVLAAAAQLVDGEAPQERVSRRLHRRLMRLNETALVIDALITAPGALAPGVSPLDAHAHLFEIERRIHNIAHLADRLAAAELPTHVREELREQLADMGSCDDIVDAIAALTASPPRERSTSHASDTPFESAVTLVAGGLPGSAIMGAQAAAGEGTGGVPRRRLRLDPPAQIAIRIAVAAAVASALGSALSERRFYWAVIAVFVAFMGTNTAGEQVIKAIHRVAGTIVGVLIGSLLATAIGHSTWSIVVIVGALGVGLYFIKVSYAAFVIGITVAVAQLYGQLGEYSNHLLLLRLEETAIGGAVAIVAALAIFPVGTRRAARIAQGAYLGSLADLLGRLGDRLRRRPADAPLSSASRALDHAHQQLLTTARPLVRNPLRRDPIERTLPLFTEAAHHARNLVVDVARDTAFDAHTAGRLAGVLADRREAVLDLARGLENGEDLADLPQLDDTLLGMLDQEPITHVHHHPNPRHPARHSPSPLARAAHGLRPRRRREPGGDAGRHAPRSL